jgi:glycogen debranching enzyme
MQQATDPDERPGDVLEAVRQKPAVRTLADAVVVKDGDVFFLCPPGGAIPLTDDHGFGLYHHDCRYLDGYDLRLSGLSPTSLAAGAAIGFEATLQLTNPEFELPGGRVVPRETLGIRWTRLADGFDLALHDTITVQNYGPERVECSLSLLFRSRFQDVFQVRGMVEPSPGAPRPTAWRDGVLAFAYEGGDGTWRGLGVHLSPEPSVARPFGGAWAISLASHESAAFRVSMVIAEERSEDEAMRRILRRPDPGRVGTLGHRSAARWTSGQARFRSDSPTLDGVVRRSLDDLRMLRSGPPGQAYYSAGIPWYATLFGRDSAITAIQTLGFDPGIAAETLRLLAAQQGRVVDPFREEEPGKILHEVRVGEFARLGLVPHARYFGTVDATPLFLVLLGHHAAWTGDLSLFRELRPAVDLALRWMDTYADRSGSGWLEYGGGAGQRLTNEGWKDSGDAIVTAEGGLATPPIALVEVQAYAWQARTMMAALFRRDGDAARAEALEREAAELRDRFERAFWMEGAGCYALALEAGGTPCRVVSSNPGHALWTGIASREHAGAVAARLMAPDMFSGWGIRTLSALERRYNPISYHLGTVWPHDNAMIAAGFRRYGLDGPAVRILASLVEAANGFPHQRLPELFAGFERGDFSAPVSYPVACHPQAWAAGSVPYLVQVLLGLEPEGFERRLRVVRPALPAFVHEVELRDVPVAGARVDLRFRRRGTATAVRAEVISVRGDLEVVLED